MPRTKIILGFFLLIYFFIGCDGSNPVSPTSDQPAQQEIVTIAPKKLGTHTSMWNAQEVFQLAEEKDLCPLNRTKVETNDMSFEGQETALSIKKEGPELLRIFRYEVSERQIGPRYRLRLQNSRLVSQETSLNVNTRTLFVFTR